MSQFLLLLHDEPSVWKSLSPEEMQKTTEKYMAWRHAPHTKDGKRLAADVGKVLRTKNGTRRATDGPYSETKEICGGFYLIEAADYDEAVKISLTHPHLDFGTIEVRKLWEA
jgi:hypothetical protein